MSSLLGIRVTRCGIPLHLAHALLSNLWKAEQEDTQMIFKHYSLGCLAHASYLIGNEESHTAKSDRPWRSRSHVRSSHCLLKLRRCPSSVPQLCNQPNDIANRDVGLPLPQAVREQRACPVHGLQSSTTGLLHEGAE